MASERDAVATIQRTYAGGINYYDLATAKGRTFSYFGAALGAALSGSLNRLKQIILIMGSSTIWMNCLTGRNTSEMELSLI